MAGERVLIVDDIQQNIELIEGFLAVDGYQILRAINGEEALEIIQQEDIDLVLLDVLMPDMDGFQVCSRIKFELNRQELPVIMITALNDRSDRMQGLKAGADDFLSKPLDWPELIVKVRAMLRLKKAHDRVQQQVERLDYQLEMARRVQQSLVWVNPPADLQGEIFYKPVDKIGGDLYDLVQLDDHRYGLFLADSSGHGVPAALVMVMVKLIFSGVEKADLSPAQVMQNLNHALIDQFGDRIRSLYVTAVYLIIDTLRNQICWANAGHPAPLIINSDQSWLELKSLNPPLGIIRDLEYSNETIAYSYGSTLFMYTDGLADFLLSGATELPNEIIREIIPKLLTLLSENTLFYSELLQRIERDKFEDDLCYTLFHL